ncbi:tRNA lysidine(34) synthetase TilS [Flavihumibacter petaseus]|uniref:tRNA(Ile)-lysidine synthase n=1 Tax=Flavihumibacter petaseus NBRC 106054 TaxID=1220578 RepID=A0A0E9N1F7_9BACT|nr:tRNA lysidine(34) synthetase TilS [Flavihumibacter petaseus]GAO43684.1 tRNA(Ile)-lysidine synthase [Flavihumibacter petaseus NBRC 106054]
MNDLVQAFDFFVVSEKMFGKKSRLLVGVSGGLDSTVLCHVLRANGNNFEMAHVNYQLRGAESERDAGFVMALAEKLGVPLHFTTVDIGNLPRPTGVSLQEFARMIRYDWLEQLHSKIDGFPFDAILTAHHGNDQAETMLLNFFRGTGLAGLKGIPTRRGRICRPLLFAERQHLEAYAQQNGLDWVDDSSNESDKYRRNFIRHEVLPLLTTQYPGITGTLMREAALFSEMRAFYDNAMTRQLQKWLIIKDGIEKLPVLALQKAKGGRAIFFAWLQAKGFSSSEIAAAWELTNSQTGAFRPMGTWRLLRNRAWIELHASTGNDDGVLLMETGSGHATIGGLPVHWALRDYSGEKIPADASEAWLDAEMITWPLQIRRWKAGDYFYPLGMPKKKKVARFLTDCKLSRQQKEATRVVESNKKIIWLAGLRIDHRFRITEHTKQVLVIRFG